jgi:hypothetical protein
MARANPTTPKKLDFLDYFLYKKIPSKHMKRYLQIGVNFYIVLNATALLQHKKN